MSRSTVRAAAFGLVVAFGTAVPSFAQVGSLGSNDQRAPDAMARLREAAAQGDPEKFAQALVGSGLPTSIILRSEEARSRRAPIGPAERDPLETFLLRYPEFRHLKRNGVTALQTMSKSPCVAASLLPVSRFTFSGPAYAALYQLVRHVNRDSRPMLPPGYIGSKDAYLTIVDVSFSNATLAEVLDEIAGQVPGVGWAIRDSSESSNATTRICLVELFTHTGWLRTSWDVWPRQQ